MIEEEETEPEVEKEQEETDTPEEPMVEESEESVIDEEHVIEEGETEPDDVDPVERVIEETEKVDHLQTLTRADLMQIANERGIPYNKRNTKSTLIKLIYSNDFEQQ